jgi:hypothetical protein
VNKNVCLPPWLGNDLWSWASRQAWVSYQGQADCNEALQREWIWQIGIALLQVLQQLVFVGPQEHSSGRPRHRTDIQDRNSAFHYTSIYCDVFTRFGLVTGFIGPLKPATTKNYSSVSLIYAFYNPVYSSVFIVRLWICLLSFPKINIYNHCSSRHYHEKKK